MGAIVPMAKNVGAMSPSRPTDTAKMYSKIYECVIMHYTMQLLASLSINDQIAVCSRYGISAVKVSTNSVKCCIWSMFEKSAVCF